jgi:hypothetical protein
MKTDIQNIGEAFRHLLGQLAWSVCKGHGSFLTFEFGKPHITIREPVATSPGTSETVRKNLARRRVFITGDWRLWIQNAHWEIETRYEKVNSDTFDAINLQDTLKELDGQRLVSISFCSGDGSCVLVFDLGTSLTLRPNANVDDDQWSIHARDGSWITCGMDGSLSEGRPEPSSRLLE